MFRYRLKIVVLSLGVLFGYTSAYRHVVHGHGHGHGHAWRDGGHECWHWPGGAHPDKTDRDPGPGAAAPKQVH